MLEHEGKTIGIHHVRPTTITDYALLAISASSSMWWKVLTGAWGKSFIWWNSELDKSSAARAELRSFPDSCPGTRVWSRLRAFSQAINWFPIRSDASGWFTNIPMIKYSSTNEIMKYCIFVIKERRSRRFEAQAKKNTSMSSKIWVYPRPQAPVHRLGGYSHRKRWARTR
jgi:hypothetical protein